MDRAEIAAHLRGLFDLGLLAIDVSDGDRRQDDITLTMRGAQVLALAELKLDRVEADLFGSVADDKRAGLRKAAGETIGRGERREEESA